MVTAWRQYTVLALLLACAAVYEGGFLMDLYQRLSHGAEIPSNPFSVGIATRTIGSGPLQGDQILAINGHAFTGKRQLDEAIEHDRPGDKLHLVLSQPSGQATETDVVIESETASDFPSAANMAIVLCLYVLVPVVCLSLGFGVAFIRPRDRNAWLLLVLLMGFSGLAGTPEWHRSLPTLSYFWEAFCSSTWAICMMLFAIYFPSRFTLDRRLPWLKYLILAPAVAAELVFWSIIWAWMNSIEAAVHWRHVFGLIYTFRIVMQMLAIGAFFAIFGVKSGTEKAPDERRRLKILRTGASISLTPMFVIALYSLIRDKDIFNGVPWPVQVAALCLLALFPLTLAYIIVVERAMDLSFVVRQSVKYGLARGGLWLLRATFVGLFIYVFLPMPEAPGGRSL